MPTGTPDDDAGLTVEPGTPDASTDLTEVVSGLSRQITSLKKQLATQAAKPDEDVAKQLEDMKRENQKYKTVLQYPDVAPVLQKLMDKPQFDPAVIDEEFVAAIRAATKPATEVEEEGVPFNPVRQGGRPSQEQQDIANLNAVPSIFDIR